MSERAQELFAKDGLMTLLGAKMVEGRDGFVVIELTVNQALVQEHDTCHGGIIFSLADAACGIAASAAEQPAVTQACSINFLRPAPVGTVLRATAIERSRAGRTVMFDVSVVNSNNDVIAELRGTTRLLRASNSL